MSCRSCNKCVFLITVLWAMMLPAGFVMARDIADNPHIENSIAHITRDLRCLTCPNESIAGSSSPMALDVKSYIVTRLEQGATDQQIITELTARYGEQLLYKPVMAPHTVILWFAPVLALLIGMGLAVKHIFMRRMTR